MKPNALKRFRQRLWPIFLHSAWVTNLLMDLPTNSQVDPVAPPVSVSDSRKEYIKEACQDLRRRLLLYLLPILIILLAGWFLIPDDWEVITNITGNWSGVAGEPGVSAGQLGEGGECLDPVLGGGL